MNFANLQSKGCMLITIKLTFIILRIIFSNALSLNKKVHCQCQTVKPVNIHVWAICPTFSTNSAWYVHTTNRIEIVWLSYCVLFYSLFEHINIFVIFNHPESLPGQACKMYVSNLRFISVSDSASPIKHNFQRTGLTLDLCCRLSYNDSLYFDSVDMQYHKIHFITKIVIMKTKSIRMVQ